jgi:hypothetical protein
LAVSATEVPLGYVAGSSGSFEIVSNTSWSVSNDASWLDVSPVSGSNGGTITVAANSANEGPSPRAAAVTISGAGVPAKTVTVSQEAGAKTMGNTAMYGETSTVAKRRAMPVAFATAATIESITIYHNGGTGNMLLGVYSDNSGSPSSKLGATAAKKIDATAGWQTVPLETPVGVAPGQTVWLSWVFENNPGVRYTIGTPGRAESSGSWAEGMPASFGVPTFASYKYSVYCTYTTSSTKAADIATDVDVIPAIEVADLKVYPNPFSEKLRFEFVSPESVDARIDLYDMTGRLVKTVFEAPVEAGVNYEADFRPETIISGMYIYRVTMGETIYNGKVVFKKD